MLEENIRKFQQQWKHGSGRSIAQRGKIARAHFAIPRIKFADKPLLSQEYKKCNITHLALVFCLPNSLRIFPLSFFKKQLNLESSYAVWKGEQKNKQTDKQQQIG